VLIGKICDGTTTGTVRRANVNESIGIGFSSQYKSCIILYENKTHLTVDVTCILNYDNRFYRGNALVIITNGNRYSYHVTNQTNRETSRCTCPEQCLVQTFYICVRSCGRNQLNSIYAFNGFTCVVPRFGRNMYTKTIIRSFFILKIKFPLGMCSIVLDNVMRGKCLRNMCMAGSLFPVTTADCAARPQK
jgi:hypothetical protein